MNFKNLLNLGTFICTILLSSTCVFAQYSGGDGSIGSPYQISNFTDLLALSNATADWNKHFIQTADIDAVSTQTMNGGAGLNRIGTYSNAFSGSYDGGDHKISNLLISVSNNAIGLFGYVNNGGQIKNLGVENATVTGSGPTGILIGDIQSGAVVSNCYTTGTVNCNGPRCGGLVGNLYKTSVLNCYSQATVISTNSFADNIGGLIGYFNPDGSVFNVTDCYSTGNVTASACNYIGGLIGNTFSNTSNQISRCYSTGNVQGNFYVGGLLGYSSGILINRCYATGDVSGSISAGGLIGQIGSNSTISTSYASGNVIGTEVETGGFIGAANGGTSTLIKNCYAVGNVDGVGSTGGFSGLNSTQIEYCYSIGSVISQNSNLTGGFIGNQTGNGVITSCFWNSETANQTVGVGNAVLSGSTTEQMKTQITFETAGWDLGETWFLDPCSSYGYPTLYELNVITMTPPPTGEAEDTYCFFSEVSNLYVEGSNVLWYANPTGGVALPENTSLSSGTTYYASQTIDGCESDERFGVAVTIINFSNEVTVDNLTITAVENDAVYYWFDCAINEALEGGFNQSYTATENGSYAVTVSKNGCSIDSDCITINTIGVNENQYSILKLFPNPTSNNLSIELGESMENITISDLSGKTIKQIKVEGTKTLIDVEDLTNGVYFIQISANGTISRASFVKQ